MEISLQDRIIAELEEKINSLKTVLEKTIVKHSDASYDLKDLKLALEDLNDNKFDHSAEKMLVMANEWDDAE